VRSIQTTAGSLGAGRVGMLMHKSSHGPRLDSARLLLPAVVWIERTGTSTFRGRNSRGATVEIAPITHDGAFTAGELLKVALAGCSGLTTDSPLARRLGDEFPLTITVAGVKDQETDRYPALTEELIVDLSGLDPEERERLITVVNRAIDAHCTVGRTLAAGVSVERRMVEPT